MKEIDFKWKERLEELLQRMTVNPNGDVIKGSEEAEFCEYIQRYAKLGLDVMPYVIRYSKLCDLAFEKQNGNN